jgi:hypothetical protein
MERPDDSQPDFSGPRSHCGISLLHGTPLSLWCPPGAETQAPAAPATAATTETTVGNATPRSCVELCLSPNRPIVIGRAQGHEVPYLDPAYQATPIVPESGQCVLRSRGRKEDKYVSRAHFTLRGLVAGGIVLTNGVPRLGGGVRPPLNWTYLLAPVFRRLDPGEEVEIASGSDITIGLPNNCVIRLAAR